MTKIIVSGSITVSEAELDEMRKALNIHAELTQNEPGCLVFNVEESESEVGRFSVYEEFVDKDAFSAHQARTRQSEWATVSKNANRDFEIKGLE